MEDSRAWVELAARVIEGMAVVLMLAFILVGTVRWLVAMRRGFDEGYASYRLVLGRALLLGLELLVAADIIRTVAVDASLTNIAILGALVLVRTFLGWTVTVEVEGKWPWQRAERAPAVANASAEPRGGRGNANDR